MIQRALQLTLRADWRISLFMTVLVALNGPLREAAAGQHVTDPLGDAAPRPMDPGAVLPFDAVQHRVPDLRAISLDVWSPDDATTDLFAGQIDSAGHFVRVQLVLAGLLNPPGSEDPSDFHPFQYGDHPVFGFIEIDMDADVDTGGELEAPQFRYLGNAVRFGGNVMRADHRARVATDGSAFDGDFESPPQVERHGEEFHIALLGTQFSSVDIEEVAGDGDLRFEAGETWNIVGYFFHRAHGYELFSFVKGGRYPGEYSPLCELQFRHDNTENATFVTLVVPLTNVGAGLMYDEPAEPTNQDPTDHASILEGLEDLQLSAFFLPILPTGLAEEAILINWAERDPRAHLDPAHWTVTAILGSSFTAPRPDDVYFLWTDIYPNVVHGDVDGSGAFDGRDRQLIAQNIAGLDPLDGRVDGVVTIVDFATNFSVFDVNHDGFVDAFDLTPSVANGDGDRDGDVDLQDFAAFQRCFAGPGSPESDCQPLDLLPDFEINLADLPAFQKRMSGPGGL